MEEKVLALLKSYDRRVSFIEFIETCAKNDVYLAFRGMGMRGVNLLDSHNQKYS